MTYLQYHTSLLQDIKRLRIALTAIITTERDSACEEETLLVTRVNEKIRQLSIEADKVMILISSKMIDASEEMFSRN